MATGILARHGNKQIINNYIFMKPTESQKKEVRGYIQKWQPTLFLHEWDFEIHYCEDVEGLKITMKTEYKDAIIEINTKVYFELSKEKREEVLVHELCHCIAQPLVHIACEAAMGRQVSQQEIDWHKESVTQHFARAIFNK